MPNIFDHAQREVHQDALVAYLFDWLRVEVAAARPEMHRAGLAIADALLGTPVIGLKQVRTQWNAIDVFALFETPGDQELVVVVENKTHTTEHSKQLSRYKDVVTKMDARRDFVGVYLKSGWIEPKDRTACSEAGFVLRDRTFWLNTLRPHRGVDPVLDQYIAFLTHNDGEFRDQLAALECRERANWALEHAHVKWALATRMFPNAAGDEIYWGSNRSGSSWVQRRVTKVELGPDTYETLFWRIDHRKPRRTCEPSAYAALRAYERFDRKDAAVRDNKLVRLRAYKAAFEQALSALHAEGCPLVSAPAVPDRSGYFESEVGTFFVHQNSINDLIVWIPKLSAAFEARCSD